LTVRDVLQLGNPILREKSASVRDFSELHALKEDLNDTLMHWRRTTGYGRGIAAPQIGVLKRVVLINVEGPWLLVNPSVTWTSQEKMTVWDACLSYLCIFFQVSRAKKIRVTYQDESGSEKEVLAEGDLSELLQHEIDHLNGVLAIDRVVDVRTICTREEYEKRYAQRNLTHRVGQQVERCDRNGGHGN
jgi:peptide deformylase